MIPLPTLEGVCAWIVRRAGLSRCAWAAAAGGLAAAGAIHPEPVTVFVGAVLVTGAAIAAWSRAARGEAGVTGRTLPVLALTVAMTAGLMWGAVVVRATLGGNLARAVGSVCVIRAEVIGVPRPMGEGIRFFARSSGPEGEGENLLVFLSGSPRGRGDVPAGAADTSGAGATLREGTLVEVRGVLRSPEGPRAGSGSFDERAWLERNGVSVVLEGEWAQAVITGSRGGVDGLLDAIRRRARKNLGIGLDGTTSSVLKGIILGDKEDIPDATLDDFRRTGIAHVLAVSGLHVGFLAAAVVLAAGALRLGPVIRATGAGAMVVFFALVTGAGPSVVRASVMVITVLLARLLGRGRDSWGVLGLAAVVVLALDPLAVTSPGFQMSFGAVGALLALTRPLEERLARVLPGRAATAAAVSLAAGLGTAPVSLLSFGQVSLVGVIANPLIVPVVPFIMGVGFASVVGGSVYAPLSAVANACAGVLIGWMTTVAHILAVAPVMTKANFAGIALGFLGAWVGWRWSAEPLRRVGGRGRWLWSGRAAAAVGGVLLLASIPVFASSAGTRIMVSWGARDWPERGEVRVLDVGEGSAVLVRSAGGGAVLIDGGPPGAGLLGQLRRLGVDRLDAVVVSHPHSDHFGGLAEVVGAIPVGMLVDHVSVGQTPVGEVGASESTVGYGDDASEVRAYLSMRGAALRAGARHVVAFDGARLSLGEVVLQLEAPALPLKARADGAWGRDRGAAGAGPRLSSAGVNGASVVVLVRVGGLAILVPGDAEATTLAGYTPFDIDCLLVPHHGSREAVSKALLARYTPAAALISVGRGNSFGHPAPETVRDIEAAGVPVFRTDTLGWIAVSPGADGDAALEVSAQRNAAQ